jgi:hypothetical protein
MRWFRDLLRGSARAKAKIRSRPLSDEQEQRLWAHFDAAFAEMDKAFAVIDEPLDPASIPR